VEVWSPTVCYDTELVRSLTAVQGGIHFGFASNVAEQIDVEFVASVTQSASIISSFKYGATPETFRWQTKHKGAQQVAYSPTLPQC